MLTVSSFWGVCEHLMQLMIDWLWVFQFTICFLFAPSEFFVLLSILSSFFWVNRIVFRILFYLLVSGYASFFFLINLFIYLFIYWLRWVFVAARGFSLVAASRVYSSLRCVGFLLRWLLLRSMGSLSARAWVVVAHRLSSCGSQALECRLSSCGTPA